jgi:hypothetical protein
MAGEILEWEMWALGPVCHGSLLAWSEPGMH